MTSQESSTPSPRAPGGSHYVNRDTARRAVELASPMIEAGLADRSLVGSGFLYLVIMDPGLPPGRAAFEEAILYEHAFGDRSRWDADYAAFARGKAQLSWASGLDSQRLQALAPHLLRAGDSLLWGGVCLDGIVVAASGAFPRFDEVYAGTVALWLRALAKEAREADEGRLSL
ncbi:MAG: hypothetical protein H6R10_1512 [Rhodocyclaceae bacterium]|nr:hypothetical protein [Rhodocyclaceae bacterium]